MLRLLAGTVAQLWENQPADATAIHIHHIDPGHEPIRREIVTRLGQAAYTPAITNDVAGSPDARALAQEMDAAYHSGLPPYAAYIARTIFMHTLAFNDPLKGLSPEQVRYSVVGPETDISFIEEARKKFITESAYLDDRPGAPMRFLAEANLSQIIRREDQHVDAGEARAELNDRIREIFSGRTFALVFFPGGPFDVPDEVGASEKDLAISIQQCYRHVFYPSRNRVGAGVVDLAHTAMELPSVSATPGSGQQQIVRALRELNKLRLAEDEPDSPAYVRDRTPLKKGQLTTLALRDEFRRDPGLPILIGDDIFLRGIRRGVEQGDYIYQRGDLLFGPGDPAAGIAIDEQALVFTMAYARNYELRVCRHGPADSEYEIWQLPAPATPQVTLALRVAGLRGRNLEQVEHRVLKRLVQSGLTLDHSADTRKRGYALSEDLALTLGLLFRTLAPMHSRANMRAVTEGIETMGREEAAYWLGMALHRKRPRRVLMALRVLLTEGRTGRIIS